MKHIETDHTNNPILGQPCRVHVYDVYQHSGLEKNM
jgi:hypothetical protein